MQGKWFDTGLKMPSGAARTVLAHNEAEECEFKAKGWKLIIRTKRVPKKTIKLAPKKSAASKKKKSDG